MYGNKVEQFFDRSCTEQCRKPLMRGIWKATSTFSGFTFGRRVIRFASVREFGQSFNTVLAYQDPTIRLFMTTTAVRVAPVSVKQWIERGIGDLIEEKDSKPGKTLAILWMRIAGTENISRARTRSPRFIHD